MSVKDEYCTIDGMVLEPYSCVLNQTEIKYNSNKFYIMQLIKTKKDYNIFIRYGRIGEHGTITNKNFNSESEAINHFKKQFKAKTSNTFGSDFVKKFGKYFLTETEKPKLDDIKNEEKNTDKNKDKDKDMDNTLDDRLKYFLELISNEKMLSDTLVSLNIDPKKMPLGKISNSQLEKAAELLKQLKLLMPKEKKTRKTNKKKEDVKEENKEIKEKKETKENIFSDDSLNQITNLSSEYYTYVPNNCGRRKPPLLINTEILDKNIELLEELKNIQITYSIIKNNATKINRFTNIYSQLDAKLLPLDKNSKMYNELTKYVTNTQASTHFCNLKVEDIYELDKKTVYDEHTKNMSNKMLLFHGSPIANWCSIIKNGLLLDPSKLGVKITGKMFGYGIYFANSISKSYNYCGADSTNNTAVLTIAEVALGDIYEQINSNYNLSQKELDKLKKNSTWGKGQSSPDEITKIDGVGIPNGKLKKNTSGNYNLLYDEFIIYNTMQYKMKYVIVVKNMK